MYPTGGIVAPLLWATANRTTYASVKNSIDMYSGTLIEGTETLEQLGERFYDTVLDIASGTMTKVETVAFSEPIQPYIKDPVF